MRLSCDVPLALGYKSASQRARVLTESWCAREMYCPACDSSELTQSPTNTHAVDFNCPDCHEPFQLKSGTTWNGQKIVDSAYSAMIAAIKSERVPNLLVLQYTTCWDVANMMVIPKLFFTESIIEKRSPLASTARRAGWIGCNRSE